MGIDIDKNKDEESEVTNSEEDFNISKVKY